MTNGAALPSALADSLMSRDIGDGDYDLLLQLDRFDYLLLHCITTACRIMISDEFDE